MSVYYQDELVTLYHGDCREVLPALTASSANALITDPPYFQVKDEEWDNQWEHAAEFLSWLGAVLDDAKRTLTANASAWVFAGPALASAVEGVVRERFRVLNHVRWVKEQGWHQKAEIEAQRRYLTPWESVIFAEQFADEYATFDYEQRKSVFVAVGAHLSAARESAGLTRTQVAESLLPLYRNLDTAKAMMSDWEIGKSYVSPAAHAVMRTLYGVELREYEDLRREYEDLRREYEALRREYEDLRRPFNLRRPGPVSDVWNFATVAPYPGKHPCEKPPALMQHIISTSTRPGDVVLDAFAGSGSTLIAARDLGRRSIGIEIDERYCEIAAKRLAQGVLDFGEVPA
jgi:site-specific DNA-methyltransferase (adenine-specific)